MKLLSKIKNFFFNEKWSNDPFANDICELKLHRNFGLDQTRENAKKISERLDKILEEKAKKAGINQKKENKSDIIKEARKELTKKDDPTDVRYNPWTDCGIEMFIPGPYKPYKMTDQEHKVAYPEQENWRKLIERMGSEEAARKELARKLRLAAEYVEKEGFPDVFGCHCEPGNMLQNSFIERVAVVISDVWPG